MEYIVERVLPEEKIVVLEREDYSHVDVSMQAFVGTPPCEGDVVRRVTGGYEVDAPATKQRRAKLIRRTEALFETREDHPDEYET